MSSMRSASSRISISTVDRSIKPWPARSSKRPVWPPARPRLFNAGNLWFHANTAEDDGGIDVQVFGVAAQVLFNLSGQFASGCQHQSADTFAAKFVLGAVPSDRRCSMGSVKAAVLPVPVWAPASRSWPARTREWPEPEWGGVFVALLLYGLENGGCQIQFFKCHCDQLRQSLARGISLSWRPVGQPGQL